MSEEAFLEHLRVEKLRKAYGAVVALEGLSLTVEAGSVHGLLGGNGSGKSTLAKILSGVVAPDGGTVRLGDRVISSRQPGAALAAGVVSTHQELSLLDVVSIEENLVLGRIPGGVFAARTEVRAQARSALDLVGLTHIDPSTPVKSLAQNERYMLELAKAVLWKPKVLIIDEITSALYRANVATVLDILRQLRSEGVAIIFIGHRMIEMLDICDVISVLRNGRIRGTFVASETSEEELLTEMIGQPPLAHADRADEVEIEDGALMLAAREVPSPDHPGRANLSVHAGQIVGIAGLQGQGQSHLLRSLFGLNSPIEYSLDGQNRWVRSPREAVRRGVAYISGDRGSEGTFAIRSLVENLLVVKNFVLKQRLRNPREYLKSLGVKFSKTAQPISSLSGGNQQKVVFGRWLSTDPKLLLADDATKGVDVAARRDLHQLLIELAENGAAVVFASSDEEELVELISRAPAGLVHVMYEGAIVRTLRGADITVEQIIEASLPVTQVVSTQ